MPPPSRNTVHVPCRPHVTYDKASHTRHGVSLPQVSLGPVLGEGEFGVTYRGTWRKSHVAAKVVRLRHAWELTSFLREVRDGEIGWIFAVENSRGCCRTVDEENCQRIV